MSSHLRVRLGAERLDDDFLQMFMPCVRLTQQKQRFDAFAPGFANADQDAAGKRYLGCTGSFDGRKTRSRQLVR